MGMVNLMQSTQQAHANYTLHVHGFAPIDAITAFAPPQLREQLFQQYGSAEQYAMANASHLSEQGTGEVELRKDGQAIARFQAGIGRKVDTPESLLEQALEELGKMPAPEGSRVAVSVCSAMEDMQRALDMLKAQRQQQRQQ